MNNFKKLACWAYLLWAILSWVFLPSAAANQKYERIVSLAPSITESLYFLDCIDFVVGVTDYDTFPPEVSKIQSVGGNINPSLEKILNLKPDLVIGEKIFHHDLLERLRTFNIDTLELTLHHRLNDVKEAFFAIAAKIDKTREAREVWEKIEKGLEERKLLTSKNLKKPVSMLVVVWHDPLIVAGGWSYISDIMEAVGIRNTAGSKRFSFPVMSKEELLSFNPDVIFLVQASKGMSITARDFISIMGDLPIKAKNGGIVSFEAEVLLHPGPRVLESADMLIKALNRASKEECSL